MNAISRTDSIVPEVAVAMSGGVDSSVAAALLVQQGIRAIGVTMKLWHAPMEECDYNLCCSVESVESARRTCRKLGIDHIVLNVEREFRQMVVEDFIAAYSRGLTPNPCVVCNRTIKFGELHRRLMALGIHKVATGHYARTERDPSTGRQLLLQPRDTAKDQTYMLYRVSQEQLASSLFPLGALTKPEVRDVARILGLESAERRDSQEVCFVPPGRYRDFLLAERPELGTPGRIVDESGRVIGEHTGVAMYTVGQRQGLGRLRGYEAQAMYVVEIRPESNTIVAGPRRSIYSRELTVNDVNLIELSALREPVRVEAKIRYTAPPAPATISPLACGRIHVQFDREQMAISPGQSGVFYRNSSVLGGGIIQRHGN